MNRLKSTRENGLLLHYSLLGTPGKQSFRLIMKSAFGADAGHIDNLGVVEPYDF